MDCHYKAGDVIILTDEEDKANLLNPNCIIEQGVTFRFYYDEPQSNQPTIEKVRRKSTRKETYKMPEQTVPAIEQKDEKTGHVMEEVILYSFLGVFIIFIVDSFARVGKYTR